MRNEYKKVAVEAALKSGLFVKRSMGRTMIISYKARNNIVTDTDKRSEKIIVKMIRSAFPDHSILAEEERPKVSDSPYKWIVDPLDGTTNFVRSFPFFCVSIALEERGRPILGVVYEPMRDELFLAEEGRGAYLNNKRIRVSKVRGLERSFLATGFSYRRDKCHESVKDFRNFLMRSMAIRRAGSAAIDLAYVACGRFDGFWEMDLKPWDSAAGALIVREAGGLVTRFDGSAYTHYDKEILATNSLIHNAMIKVLKS